MELRGGTATVGNGPALPVLDVQHVPGEYDYVRSELAVLPDPTWSATDSNGHEHRWTTVGQKDAFGRLKYDALSLDRSSRHVDCGEGQCDLGGDCEGYSVPVWTCRKCGKEVEPGYAPDWRARGEGLPIQRVGPSLELRVDLTPELAGRSSITMPEWPPAWTDVVVTAGSGGGTLSGKGMIDRSGVTITNGEPPTALVRFSPA